MAIEYVGGVSVGRNGNANATTTQSLTGLTGGIASAPAENDLVIVCCAVGSQGRNAAQAISGYTTLGTQLNATAVTYDTSMQVSYKVMTSTPDTSITIPAQGNVADGQAWAIMVFRGVDTTTPFDPASVSATGTATGRPNPAAITPANSGAWVVIGAAAAAAATTTAFTAPTDFATDFVQATGADTNDCRAAMGYYTGWTSGSYDPAQFTGGTTGANDSWAAWTMALKPGVATTLKDLTYTGTGAVSRSNLTTAFRDFTYSGIASLARTLTALLDKTFTGSGTSTYSKVADYVRSFSVSGIGSYVFEQLQETFAGIKSLWPGWLTNVGAEAGAVQYTRDFTYTGTGSSAFSRAAQFLKSLSFTAIGSLALSKIASYLRAFSYSGLGTSVLSRVASYLRSLTYVGFGTSVLARIAARLRSLSFSGTASAAFSRLASRNRSFAYSGVGTTALSRAASLLKSFTYTVTGSAAFSWMRVFLRDFAYTGIGTSAFSRIADRAYNFVYTGIGTLARSNLLTLSRTFAYTGMGTNVFSRIASRFLSFSFSGLASAAFEKTLNLGNQMYTVTVTFIGTATSALVKQIQFPNVFTVTGSVTRASAVTFQVVKTYTGRAVWTLAKQVAKSLAYTGRATITVLKLVSKAMSFVGTAAVSYSDAFLTSLTKIYTGIGTLLFEKLYLPFTESTVSRTIRRALLSFINRR